MGTPPSPLIYLTRLTRTFRTVFLLSLRIFMVTQTSSPWVYQALSKLARNPTRPSCSRKGLSTAPCGPPPPPQAVTPATLSYWQRRRQDVRGRQQEHIHRLARKAVKNVISVFATSLQTRTSFIMAGRNVVVVVASVVVAIITLQIPRKEKQRTQKKNNHKTQG